MFKNLSVSKKIAAGFLTLALIGAVAGGTSAIKTSSALQEVETANALSDLNSETARLSEKISGQALAVKSFLLTGNRDWRQRSEDLNSEISAQFAKVQTLVDDTGPQLPGLLSELETSWKAWFNQIAAHQMELMRTPETVDMARAIELTPESTGLLSEVQKQRDEFTDAVAQKRQASLVNQNAALGTVQFVAMASAVLLTVLAVVLGVVNHFMVSAPLTRLSDVTEKLATGDTTSSVDV
ncbi:CHASE3 domain-containing protein, partial [Roseibium sp.]